MISKSSSENSGVRAPHPLLEGTGAIEGEGCADADSTIKVPEATFDSGSERGIKREEEPSSDMSGFATRILQSGVLISPQTNIVQAGGMYARDFDLVPERLAMLIMQPECPVEHLFSDGNSPVWQLNCEGAVGLNLLEGDGLADRPKGVSTYQADGIVSSDRHVASVAHRPNLRKVGIGKHAEVVGDRDVADEAAVSPHGLLESVRFVSHIFGFVGCKGFDRIGDRSRRELGLHLLFFFILVLLFRLGLNCLFLCLPGHKAVGEHGFVGEVCLYRNVARYL